MYTAIFLLLLLALFIIVVAVTTYLLRTPSSGATETFSQYPTADFSSGGFNLTAYPTDEILIPREYCLINGTTGQIRYNVVPNDTVYLRMAPTGQLILPTNYTNKTYESVTEYPIDDVTVSHKQSAGQQGLLQWSKNGFDYALYASEPEMNLLGGLIDDFVRLTTAESMTTR